MFLKQLEVDFAKFNSQIKQPYLLKRYYLLALDLGFSDLNDS